MKKLIVLSVVLALVASAAFAVDLSASIFGRVTLVEGDTDNDEISASGGFERIRFDGYGEVADGAFGGWIRFDGGFNGYAFWKPIDQLKIVIGGNPDGMYGKEGITGWMFNETPYDAGVAIGGNNVWGWGPGGDGHNLYGQTVISRNAFYGGFGGNALHLNITPFDILTINIVLPFFDGGEIADVILKVKAQVDLNFDFGNIAVTYDGHGDGNGGQVYAYFGAPIGPLSLDVGFAYGFEESGDYSMGAGVGLKFATDVFGIRFRAITKFTNLDYFGLLAELVPYFTFSDNFAMFINAGLSMSMTPSDTLVDFHANPYVRIGEEWGAQFLAGFKIWSEGGFDVIKWGVPIAIALSF